MKEWHTLINGEEARGMSKSKWAVVFAGLCLVPAAVAIAYAAGAQAAAPVQEVVRAKCFELVNNEGEERAKLDLTLDGSPSLSMCDETGRVRLILQCSNTHGLSLQMFDRDVTPRLALSLFEDGRPEIRLLDSKGMDRVLLTVESDGPARLDLLDNAGEVHATLGVLPDGSSMLVFRDESNRPRVSLTEIQSRGSGLTFEDSQGIVRADILVAEDGRGVMNLRGPDGNAFWSTR